MQLWLTDIQQGQVIDVLDQKSVAPSEYQRIFTYRESLGVGYHAEETWILIKYWIGKKRATELTLIQIITPRLFRNFLQSRAYVFSWVAWNVSEQE